MAAPSSTPVPEKWQLMSWSKKDEQFNRIPAAWRLPRLPPQNVTNYLDIPRKCGLLNEEELRITKDYDATSLAEAIRRRELKCVDVARAFCKVPYSASPGYR
jgi:amidase